MNNFAKAAMLAVLLLLSATSWLAAEVKAPASEIKASYAKSTAKTMLVDINSATTKELKALPGIGDPLAARIIAGRPYANKAQLKSRKVVSSTLYEQFKEMIIAKQIRK